LSDRTERIVHLVDHDERTRRSTRFLLEALGYEVSSHAALEEIPETGESGCVLVDVSHCPGPPDIIPARLQALSLPAVALSGSGKVVIAAEALRGGAVDFIEKPFRKQALVDAIEAALSVSAEGTASLEREAARARIARLTPREREVLCGLARGRSNKMIAFELGISPRTTEIHRARMMNRLGVSTLSQALRVAFSAGLEGESSTRSASPKDHPIRGIPE
jgi:two-component system response regulator FixJ